MQIPWHRNSKPFYEVCHSVFGRKMIISNRTKISTPKEAIEELEKALPIHNQNRREMDYLYHYVSGDQPILYRIKDVRPEINNKIVENHALEISRFMTAQNYGEPIQYVSVSDDEEKSKEIDKLNNYMKTRSKDYHDIVLGDFQSTCGTAYRETWSLRNDEVDDGEPPFDICSPDPRYNFVIYSNAKGNPPLMSVSVREDTKGRTVHYCTTKSHVYYIRDGKYVESLSSVNGHGRLLLIEFPNNPRRLSDIEIVSTLTDAINNVQSNRLDGVEQFVQAFIKFVNCEIDEQTFLKMCKIGALKVKTVNASMPADVNSVSNELDQEQTQTLKDDLYKNMLIIEGMPSREQNTGGDTGQAVYLRNGWDFAEQRAKIDEPVTKRSGGNCRGSGRNDNGGDSNKGRDQKELKYKSARELFEKEWFPKAYLIGISWKEFWHLNPHIIMLMIEGYGEHEKMEIQKQNYLAHLQGQYICEALMATVGNMLSKKGTKKYQYPKKPYEFENQKEFTEEELQKQRELFVARLEAMKTNFELNNSKNGTGS